MLSGGIQENMIDLPEGYPPEWVGMLMLMPLLHAWSFGWFLCSIGLIFISTVFLTVCVIMGGNLRSMTPATHSLITAVRCIWFLISRLRRRLTSPVQWTAIVRYSTLATSGVGSMLLFRTDKGGHTGRIGSRRHLAGGVPVRARLTPGHGRGH